MSEDKMRRCTIDLILWADPAQVRTIWAFVSSYMSGEKVGIHADDDYIIAHAEFLKSERRKAAKAQRRGESA